MVTKSQTADPRRLEAIVLMLLLDAHPTPVAETDLVRSLDDRTNRVEIDVAIEVAVRALSDSGLANVADGLIFPTIAAVQLDQLLAD